MRHASAETKDLAAPGNGVLAGVPAVVAAHHLFSRAPPALQSPMSRSGLTPAQVRVPLSSSCRGNGVFTSAWCLASSLRLFACRTGPSLHARDALCHTLQLQYSAWLDQHSSAEALRSIKAAIEASPAAAREEAEVVPLMLRLCSGGG